MALNDVPLITQNLAQTQNPIRVNFQTIDTAFSVNHVSYGIADQGKHKFLQLPEQGVAPATAVNEAGLYSAVGAFSTVSELVFRRENNGVSIPFTEVQQTGQKGWTRLPSGLVLKWGIYTVNAGATTADAYIVGPGAFTTVYNFSMSFTNAAGNTGGVVRSVTTAAITVNNIDNVNNISVYYSILGVL